MSTDNSIAPNRRDMNQQTERSGFEIPPELAARYEVRIIDAPGSEQRIGLFRPGDRGTPAIEIAGDRIVARSEDVGTIASLVEIARHNGWDRIDVNGSPEFCRAVWTAATREGLAVSGYAPTFIEQERMQQARRDAADQRETEAVEHTQPAARAQTGAAIIPAQSPEAALIQNDQDKPVGASERGLSDNDWRLLVTLSRHTEDRDALYERLDADMDSFQREVHYQRIEANREALDGALERVLESPTLRRAFEQSGYEPDTLRQSGKGDDRDGEIASAIHRVRSDLDRDTYERQPGAVAALAEEIKADREDRLDAISIAPTSEQPLERGLAQKEQTREAAARRHHDSGELADLFLHGAAEKADAEPRLVNALQAQTVMEQHIGEVFEGDVNRIASANFESRQMISAVLRRGLDVSVREPTPPERQIEPIQTRPDLER